MQMRPQSDFTFVIFVHFTEFLGIGTLAVELQTLYIQLLLRSMYTTLLQVQNWYVMVYLEVSLHRYHIHGEKKSW